jgi:hypothetical protein
MTFAQFRRLASGCGYRLALRRLFGVRPASLHEYHSTRRFS